MSTLYTVVHYMHKCMCNTCAIPDTSVWSHSALSCSPRVAVLYFVLHISVSRTASSQRRALGILLSAHVYLQSLKMWTREWFMFALLMNVPSFFLHWIIDSFSNPQHEQEKHETAFQSNRHLRRTENLSHFTSCFSFYCLYSIIINRLGRFTTYTQ